MEIIVDGQNIELVGFQNLDDEINQAFKVLFTIFYNDPDRDFANLVDNLLPPFEQAMFAFFDRNVSNTLLQDRFFSNLTLVWKRYFDAGRFGEAQGFWIRILHKTREWEQQAGQRVHKGSAFYFWANTAFLQGEVDKGFFLMHQALEEDVLTSQQPAPNRPAFMFVTLDFQDKRQFFYEYVKSLADFFNQFFIQYRFERVSVLTIEEFRERFLKNPPSIHAVFSFTHSLSRFWSIYILPLYILESEFAGQYELNVIFDMLLVIDESIRSKHPNPDCWRFVELAEYLATQSGIDVTRQDIIYAKQQMDASFDQTMSDLLDGVFRFENGNVRSKLGCDLSIVYCLRNHAAHNLSAFPSIWRRFESLKQSIFNVLLLTVDVLY